MADTEQTPVRRAEILACLSMATDLAMGQPIEFALRSCVLAVRFGRALGLVTEEIGQTYYQALLRYVGCNAETHIMAALLGDEIAFRREFALIDMGRAQEVGALVFNFVRRANADAGAFRMLAGVVSGLASSKSVSQQNLASHCEVAQRISERLRLGEDVRTNLGQVYERWDGKGLPYGLKGEAVSRVVQIVTLVQDWIVLEAAFGADGAKSKLL